MAKKGKSDTTGDFGGRLKSAILKSGYSSVEKFAFENGFDRVTIYRIVEKGADPRLSMILRILEALEVEPNDLLKNP